MGSAARVLGMLTKTCSVFRKVNSNNGSMHRNYLVELHIQRVLSTSCNDRWVSAWVDSRTSVRPENIERLFRASGSSFRKISICVPLNMGRRSCKIATRKGAQNLKKSKLYGKIGKEVISAVKREGPNPVSNPILAGVLEKARQLDVPKEILERNIKKASEKGQQAFIEKFYEVYGLGGVGLVVEVLTDNLHRTAQQVRDVVRKNGGKMADPGSILFKFRRARVLSVKDEQVDKDKLLAAALDAGAEDVIEPAVYEDDTEDDQSERYFKVVTSTENYSEVMSKFCEEGIPFDPDNGLEMLPMATIEMMKPWI
eukprot:Gb_10258 [translate_table: standard]